MNHKLLELSKITERILNSTIENKLEVEKLYSFFNQFDSFKDCEGDIQLQNGIALSKKNAADCIKDYKRTQKFLKGIYEVIHDALKKFDNTPLNIIYAGCGPFGTLLVPLLSFFNSQQLRVTFLDINKSSVKSLQHIITQLGLTAFVSDILVSDATTYKFQKNKNLHIVLTETMFHALTKEPQVAITNNLSSQIHKEGFLIPQEIEISKGYSFFSKEPYLNQYDNEYYISNNKVKSIQRSNKSVLFSINKENSVHNNMTIFKSDLCTIPKNFEHIPDICIYTKVKIYKNFELNNEESLITNPYCIASFYTIPKKSKFKINYNINKNPNWEISIY